LFTKQTTFSQKTLQLFAHSKPQKKTFQGMFADNYLKNSGKLAPQTTTYGTQERNTPGKMIKDNY